MNVFETATVATGAIPLLTTALMLGLRHGIDWDHIAAIADITGSTSAADAGEASHEEEHRLGAPSHDHGGGTEVSAHTDEPRGASLGAMALAVALPRPDRRLFLAHQRRAVYLGTLYALGHALVVALLGFAALQLGAVLPAWVDPLMGRVVGVTLLLLGIWVFVSLYQYARHGQEFRLRSRWMLVFDGIRYGWRRIQARLHGHEHARPLEMSSYGGRTAFLVGTIHGIGAETGTQVLLIAAIGGAADVGLGLPMMVAFIVGLVVSNTAIVLISAAGFVTSQLRKTLYLVVGAAAGVLSVVMGILFILNLEGILPPLA